MNTRGERANQADESMPEVDAARLLLILNHFAHPITEADRHQSWFPVREVERHFTPEYYLHKLDFLLRYPGYFAYELIELYHRETFDAQQRNELITLVRRVLHEREPELLTQPFRRFWRGAYERLDEVEAWWHARGLVYTQAETRGNAAPQKHYFMTSKAQEVAHKLVEHVEHARWYAQRIALIHQYFGRYSAAQIKALQYSHEAYRNAQLNETIPDLDLGLIDRHFERVFGEPLGVSLEAV
jgi:hypothetical protein